jgi:site-specific recombinase XerD
VPRRRLIYLKKNDLEKLLAAPLGDAPTEPSLTQLRDKAILELIWSIGLKVSQVTALKRAKFNPPSSEQARYWLNQYLRARRDTNPYLFIAHDRAVTGQTRQATGLSPRSIERMIAKYKKLCGLTRSISPETLRRHYHSL